MTDVRPEQFMNAPEPILVTLFGIVIDGRLEQSAKNSLPILVTPFPIMTEVRPEHRENA